jgi:flagellar biosynthesis regulator FlaF
MPQGRRSRIVIDVDRVQAEAREKRARRFGRAGRVLGVTGLIVIGVLLVLLVGSYAWWQSFKKSPSYSLALLVDAAQHDDVQAVETMIDADQIAQGFVPQVIENLTGAESQLPPQARASLTATLPALLPRVRETMRDEIARVMKGLSQNESSSLPFFVKALGVRRASTVVERGDAATVNVKAGERPVELSMRRDGERWKLVTVRDPQLTADIATRLAASLPASPQPQPPQNQPRRRGTR